MNKAIVTRSSAWSAGMRRLALVVAAAGLAGCAALAPRLETPRLSLIGLQLVEATLFEQRLQVRLRVQNPNDIALPVRGLSVDFELDGEEFAQGVTARAFEVPAFGEAEFDMMITANAATAILKIFSRGRDREVPRESLDYRIKGKLSTSLGLLRSVPFEETGTIPLGALTGGGAGPGT
jgi:LEA14-like dessication related protein